MISWKERTLLFLAVSYLVLPMAAKAEATVPEFNLETVNVTALRHISKDLDTPADITVYTNEQLKNTGAHTLIDSLKFTPGMMYQSMGPYGQANGQMASRVIIRGVEKGTLVLLNGVPINLNGAYYLEQIPIEQVDKVEIVKGSGSVLYGSEAFGGVINIITKKAVENSICVASGNQGQDADLALQMDKVKVLYNYSKAKDTGIISDSLTGYGESEKNSVSIGYQFNEKMKLDYMYSQNAYPIYKKNTNLTLKENRDYTDNKHFWQIAYKEGQWENKFFWNHQTLENEQTTYTYRAGKSTSSVSFESTKNNIYGMSTQRNWQTKTTNWVVGLDGKKEAYETTKATKSHSRTNYAGYLQYDTKVSAVTRLILSAREDFVNTDDGQKLNAFCPQMQTLTKINDTSSWYTSIGKTFRMPTFTQLYKDKESDFVPNPDLKPETGYNYEIGYKKHYDKAQLKVAVFRINVSEQIDWRSIGKNKKQAQNLAGFHNTGLEVSYDKEVDGHLSYSLGCSYSNPKTQENSGDPWERTMGRVQLTSSINYKNKATSANLSAMYYTNRVGLDGTKVVDRKAMLPVNLHVGYALNPKSSITFAVDNLLNRQDITTNGDSIYYSMPRSYKLGYIQRF